MIGRIMSFAVLAVFIFSFASLANAATDPGVACAVSKQKAAAKKLSAKVKCHGTALKKGIAVDAECLTKAEGKFNDSFTKAEDKGGCVTTGDTAAIEATIDATLANLLAALPSAPAAVCQAGDAAACLAFAVPDSDCENCCFSVGDPCSLDCLAASAAACTDAPSFDACNIGINAAGCAAVCCP
jgi:hypothetical protein